MGRVIAAERRHHAVDDPALRAEHRRLRVSVWRHVIAADAATVLSAPVIYSLILPFALLDLWVTIYQAICFRAWGIAGVRRRLYFAIDHQKLAYLNGLEKLNCVYCSYINGLIAYVREIAARTEQYWCPIRHARHVRQPHDHYAAFVEYGDARGYREGLPGLRAQLKK